MIERGREKTDFCLGIGSCNCGVWHIPKSMRQASSLKILEGVDVTVLSPKAVWRQNSFLFKRLQSFFFFLRPLNDWMRPTHIMEGNLLYSESILWNTHQSQKKMPSQEHLAWPNILAKLACRINHHSLYVKWDLRMKVGSYDNTE